MDLSKIGTIVNDAQHLYDLRTTFVQSVYHETFYNQQVQNGTADLSKRFPGTRSVSLAKRDFNFVRRNQYWVCEKSDGTRCMLITMTEGLYLVDESFQFYFVDKHRLFLPSVTDPHRQQIKTILDGEMVFNHHYGKAVYMVFDVICSEGTRVGDLALSKRLDAIRNSIVAPLRKHYKSEEAEAALPFIILGKDFLPLEKLDSILSKIQHFSDEQGHRYVYQNGKRYNENDGLVFTPEHYPYKPGRSTVTKKWKWPELNTVDFFVQVTTEAKNRARRVAKLHLWGGNQQRHVEVRSVFFPPKVMQRLLDDLNGSQEGIIECAYDSEESGEWQYIRARHDKMQANGMTAAFIQMESVADRITKEYLRAHLLLENSKHNHKRELNSSPGEIASVDSRTPSTRTPSTSQTPIDHTPTPVDMRSEEESSPLYNETVYNDDDDPISVNNASSTSPGKKRTFSQCEKDGSELLDTERDLGTDPLPQNKRFRSS